MRVGALPEPTTSEFEQYRPSAPTHRVYIDREFLKFTFAEDVDGDAAIKKRYGEMLIEFVENTEIAFRELHISRTTLAAAIIYLQRNVSDSIAEACLEEVRSNRHFVVREPERDTFDQACQSFIDMSGGKPNFAEFIDAQIALDDEIEYVLTWDSDFEAFPELTMLPHSRWNRS